VNVAPVLAEASIEETLTEAAASVTEVATVPATVIFFTVALSTVTVLAVTAEEPEEVMFNVSTVADANVVVELAVGFKVTFKTSAAVSVATSNVCVVVVPVAV
jgi:hypothetical protein